MAIILQFPQKLDNDEMIVGTDFMGDVDLRQHHPHHAGAITFLFSPYDEILYVLQPLLFPDDLSDENSECNRLFSTVMDTKIKIALSLYKVQQNIYLLDFQRVEVQYI